MPTTTLRGDTVDLTQSAPWVAVGFYENLGSLARFARGDAGAPWRINMTGLLGSTGQFFNQPKWNRIANLIQRRDVNSGGQASSVKLTSRNDLGVRVSMKFQNIRFADSNFDQNGITPELVQQTIGTQIGEAWGLELRAKMIGISMALAQAIPSQVHDYSEYVASGTKQNMRAQSLANALSKLGDRSDWFSERGGWLFHTKPYTDLFLGQLGSSVAGIADVSLNNGNVATLNMPYVKADDSNLIVTSNGNFDIAYTLGVGPGLIDYETSGIKFYPPFLDVNQENPDWVYAGSMELLISCNGFKYDSNAFGSNPTNDSLFNPSAWIYQASNHKEVPVVRVVGNVSAANQ